MIRREEPRADGDPRWLLISQLEHARLAHDVAVAWGAPQYHPLVPRDLILDAVLHHDDGWQAWEMHPDIEPLEGRPRNFLEMAPSEALCIWRESILIATKLGALEAYMVSTHFTHLAERSSHHTNDTTVRQAMDSFIREQTGLQKEWLAGWVETVAMSLDEQMTLRVQGYHAAKRLRMFDALSLWLCMSGPTEPLKLQTNVARERPLVFTPQGPYIQVAPWPFEPPIVKLSIRARGVPMRKYIDADDLAGEPGDWITLSWQFVPGIEPSGSQISSFYP